ncbi:MAG: HAD-superfamily hydrolase, subfamily variant 3 [Clostridia bacterium]|jgi:phosphoglycolate phosphatase|nr:HAD-superfamily hydrolase, subfamily variant 3 [Clostridia bacterium]
MYRLVIFDLDGTLLNTITDLANACNYALRACCFKEHSIDTYKTYVGDGVYKLIWRMLPINERNDETVQRVKIIFDTYYATHNLDYTEPYAGIVPLLEKLQGCGIHCAVASNKPHEYTKELVKLMFGEKIELAFGQRQGIPCKPDPAIVLEIARHFQVSPEECIYVGDSDVDMYTAQNAGITSVAVLWGFRTEKELTEAGAHHVVRDTEALGRLIIGR